MTLKRLFVFFAITAIIACSAALAQEGDSLADLTAKAAKKDVEAEFLLGWRYYKGSGAPKNEGEAARWMKKAAEGGHAEAQYYTGVMYEYGRGLPLDFAAARKWFLKSADQENSRAQGALGWIYVNGWGVKPDLNEACKWFMLASLNGKMPGAPRCVEVEKQLTVAEIAAAREKAQNIYFAKRPRPKEEKEGPSGQ